MARDISIAINVKDNFSQTITSMRNANQNFIKDLSELQTKIDGISKIKTTIKVDTKKAKEDIKDVGEEFLKTNKAFEKFNQGIENISFDNINQGASTLVGNLKEAKAGIETLSQANSKADNSAGKTKLSGKDVLSKVGASAAKDIVGDVVGEVATTFIGSAYGSDAATVASSTLSTAAMGAAIGTSIAPGIGTAIGALGGAVLGFIQGQNKVFEKKDDAFKSYYKDLYDNILNDQANTLQNGSAVAANRELDEVSFSRLLGGESNAEGFLSSLSDFAIATPFSYDELTSISKELISNGYKQEEVISLLQNVGDAGTALGLGTDQVKTVATALGSIQTSDSVSLDDINPLIEQGIDVWSILSENLNDSKENVIDMVNDGLLPGAEAAKMISDYMGKEYSGSMEQQAQTFSEVSKSLQEAQAAMDSAMGEGYNAVRSAGMQEQVDWLSGDSGEEMKDAYDKIGQWKASLENKKEQTVRDAVASVMDGKLADSYQESKQEQKDALEGLITEYKLAQSDYYDASKLGDENAKQQASADMGRILAEAQAIGTNEYNGSDEAQLALESNLQLAENIKNDTGLQDAYWDAGQIMGQQFALGLASVEPKATVDTSSGDINWTYTMADYDTAMELQRQKNKEGKHNAYGLSYVPYNNYPAMLHEGERVLTASENRNYGSGTPVNITGNTFVVRQESDIKSVAKEIANLINRAYVLAT